MTLILPLLVVALAVGLGWQLRAWQEHKRAADHWAEMIRNYGNDDSDSAGA